METAFHSFEFGDLVGAVGFLSTLVILQQALEKSSSVPCNADLYDRFLEVQGHFSSALHRDVVVAVGKLYHPKRADANPFFQLGKNHPELRIPSSRSDKIRGFQLSEKGVDGFGQQMLRAAFLLQADCRAADADWLKSVVEHHYPRVWQKREVIRSFCSRDPKLQDMIRNRRCCMSLAVKWH